MAEAKAKETLSKAPKKGPQAKPDLASLGGVVLGVGGILGGMVLEKGELHDLYQITAFIIVIMSRLLSTTRSGSGSTARTTPSPSAIPHNLR